MNQTHMVRNNSTITNKAKEVYQNHNNPKLYHRWKRILKFLYLLQSKNKPLKKLQKIMDKPNP